MKNLYLIITTQIIILIILIGVSLRFMVAPQTTAKIISPISQVLGSATSNLLPKTDVINVMVLPSPISQPKITAQLKAKIALRPEYTIAIVGDSMEDTMGEYADYLEHEIERAYPMTKFNLFNYGRGSQTVEEALGKIDQNFNYQTRVYPPLPSINPDIIIVGSFAYNPFTPYDRNRHWISLTRMIEKLKTITPNVYLLAEMAPLRSEFGKGPQGVNWETGTVITHSGHIIEQLQNAVGLSKTLNIPVINVFADTYNEETKSGNAAYIDPSDDIHPSVYGHEKMAEKIVETLQLN
ncbi:hypothetical protein A2690_01465 [Candidatus Roizmanbacteria bacterium RIFCSPHIGHO2_01_FULL_39_12b]|uniref:SGNH hydrolase-type esterase domain-containing protein n=1 Tax=Candidatus Roizmanbacteria bacterium RIFCSPHIGHO2_01_FULL_39_12b TaxID=1802030 RepID=A0A1F7GDB6_9BACT|nr:MAG: hypothetical protein A2690_01465 [Candidatus Roizmanbacteria bacterium RIFCSPHIGHO2_01_FULL_39_12b]